MGNNKKTRNKLDFKKFISGDLDIGDFSLRYVVRRIRRLKCNQKKMAKLMNAKTEREVDELMKKVGNPFSDTNSWYYALDCVCDDFNDLVRTNLGNDIQSKKRHKNYKKMSNCKCFGMLRALRWMKLGNRYRAPRFKSLVDCQRWCDNHGLEIDVKKTYAESKKA